MRSTWVLLGLALGCTTLVGTGYAQRRGGGDAPKAAGEAAKVYVKCEFEGDGNVENFQGPVAWSDDPGGALGSGGAMKITTQKDGATAERYIKWEDNDTTIAFMIFSHGVTSAYCQGMANKAGKNLHAYFKTEPQDQWVFVTVKAASLIGFGGGASSPGESYKNFMFHLEGTDKAVEEPYLLVDNIVIYAGEDGKPPTEPPAELTVNFYKEKKLASVNWKAAKDDVGVYRYELHRSDTPEFTPAKATLLATVYDTYYEDGRTTAGKTYYYKVVGKDLGGFVVSSAEVKYTAPPETGTAPAAAGKKTEF